MHLHADGIWFLIKVASARNYYFWVVDWRSQFYKSRAFTILAEQTPVVLATHLRIHSLHALSLIYGVTLYCHALIALYLCYRFSTNRWYVLFPLLSLFAGSMNAEAVPANDSHFVLSLYWPVLFILLFRPELKRGTLWLLVGLSIPMVLSYESMLFFGVILASVCVWRLRRFAERRTLMVTLAAWYVLSSLIALAATIWPFDSGNKSGFSRGILVLLASEHLAAKVSILVLLCCAAVLMIPSRLRRVHFLILAAGLLSVAYLIFQVATGHAPLSLDSQMPARVLNLLVPLAATALLLCVLAGVFKPDSRAIGLTAILVGALGFGQAFWNLGCIMRWQGMLATLRYEMTLHEGPVAYENSVMSRKQLGPLHLNNLGTGWSLLPLSIYESGKGQVRSVVVGATNGFLPFDPFAPSTFPDLSRYGIRYDEYRDALQRNWRYRLGDTLTFTRGGSAFQFLRTGWASPEEWATWSEGQDSSLELPVQASGLPKSVILEARVVPLLSPENPSSTAEVIVNDVNVGQWSFEYIPEFEIRNMQVRISSEVLLRSNPVQIRFHIREPLKSPMELGKGADPRKLGLAFTSLRLVPGE